MTEIVIHSYVATCVDCLWWYFYDAPMVYFEYAHVSYTKSVVGLGQVR